MVIIMFLYIFIVAGLFISCCYKKSFRQNTGLLAVYISLAMVIVMEVLYLKFHDKVNFFPRASHQEAVMCKVYIFTGAFITLFLEAKGVIIYKYKHLNPSLKYLIFLWVLLVPYDIVRIYCADEQVLYYEHFALISISTQLFCFLCAKLFVKRADFIYSSINKRLFVMLINLELFVLANYALHVLLLIDKAVIAEFLLSFIILVTTQLILTLALVRENQKFKKPRHVFYDSDNACNPVLLDDGEVPDDEEIMRRLMILFDKEKPFLNPDYKVFDASLAVGTNTSYTARAISKSPFNNFKSLCNYYRVMELCSMIAENPNLDIMQIYKQAGFTSRGVFNNSFLLYAGESPVKWTKHIRQLKENREPVRVENLVRYPRHIPEY
jgi:AraC-like DNA-binding protein